MPEGVKPYPRWEGPLSTGRRFGAVASNEIRRAFNNFWSRLTLTAAAAFAIVYISNLYQNRNVASTHTVIAYVDFLNFMSLAALAVAAVAGGPSLLDDARRGALELYRTRTVTRTDYLTGKILAVFVLTSLSMLVPALLYYGSTYMFFERHPDKWELALPGAVLYSLIWALMVSGLALGLSSVARSSLGATLLLLGGAAVLDIVVSELLEGLTRNPVFELLSPFSALQQQREWIFQVAAPFQFATYWAFLEIIGLTVLGWGLLAWKHPRVRGEDRAGA